MGLTSLRRNEQLRRSLTKGDYAAAAPVPRAEHERIVASLRLEHAREMADLRAKYEAQSKANQQDRRK